MYGFLNKVVLVIGGTSGIGLKVAQGFAEEKAKVIITGRNEKKSELAIEAIKDKCGSCEFEFIRSDNGRQDEIDALYTYIKNHYKRLDIAVNNASIFLAGKKIHEYSLEEYTEIMNINLTGMFLSMQHQLRIMLEQHNGSIINIASNVGVRANTYGSAPYIISKHGTVGLTRVAALEYALDGIRVNAVLPGLTDTDMFNDYLDAESRTKMIENNPMKRLINPEEIANAVLFLASESASAINGIALPVDCGKMVKT